MYSSLKAYPAYMLRLLCILLVFCCTSPLLAEDQPRGETTETWLVTYGPGDIYWQRFGHNAIWIRDSGLGLDHVFNFGFFDFRQQNFFLRFLQGRMLYFSAARPSREEFASYIDENRSIRAQRLDLSPQQKLQLIEYLVAEIRPENRDYLYDYYDNNCSTRVRDVIDQALGGALAAEFKPIPAEQTQRNQTRRLTAGDFWLYLGLETGLGSPVDRSISRWDEMFIPMVLADAVDSVEFTGGGLMRPLVLEDVVLFESSLDPPAETVRSWWPRYLLASIAAVFLMGLLSRYLPPGSTLVISRSWLIFSGLLGLGILALWFGTNHQVARLNLNLLVFCPLWIPLALWKNREKTTFRVIVAFSGLAVLMNFLPPQQYTLDVLAAFLPLNLAAALGLIRSRSRQADQPGVPVTRGR